MADHPLDPRAVAAEIEQLQARLRMVSRHSKPQPPHIKDAGAALRAALKSMDDIYDARRAGRTGLTDAIKAIRQARAALDRGQS